MAATAQPDRRLPPLALDWQRPLGRPRGCRASAQGEGRHLRSRQSRGERGEADRRSTARARPVRTARPRDAGPREGPCPAQLWADHREDVYQVVNEMFRVEGDWSIEIDDQGTEFHYAPQKIGVDAHIKAVINGTAYLVRDSVEIPFTIEKRLGAAAHMGNIRYDKDKRAVVGDVEDPFIDLGDGVILQALSQAGAQLLAQQTERFRATPLIKDQLPGDGRTLQGDR